MRKRVSRPKCGPVAPCNGFSLVELLVVIFIIGVLVALLLPAVQSAREAGRRTNCQNHLKQIALAAQLHVKDHGHFPSGGWGASWTGDPDRGFGKSQPGGWVYNVLPYIEEGALRDLGKHGSTANKLTLASTVSSTPLSLMNCPSRRAAAPYPHRSPYVAYNCEIASLVGRTDYAMNVGHNGFNSLEIDNAAGPKSLSEEVSFPFPKTKHISGICFLRSEVAPASVTDGTSKTLMAGEKYLRQASYLTGDVPGDRGHMYQGTSPDSLRLAEGGITPRQDGNQVLTPNFFGAPHPAGCTFAFCDGSVRLIAYEIAPEVFEAAGTRNGGESSLSN